MVKTTVDLLLIDVRSAHNVGAILRSAAAFGVKIITYSGHTPYPRLPRDTRLPHIINNTGKKIAKTALGSQNHVQSHHIPDPLAVIDDYRRKGWRIAALEQAKNSIDISSYKRPAKLLLILGSEPVGLPQNILDLSDDILEIELPGAKESLNVAVAAGIALFSLT